MTPGLLLNGGGSGLPVKKRVAPQPPKPTRSTHQPVVVRTLLSVKNKVDDSYSTMSTVSVNSLSPNSTVSEKSIKVQPNRMALPRKLPTSETIPGWIRIYCGADHMRNSDDDPNKVLQVNQRDTVKEIVIAMKLPLEYTIWLQIGGLRTRRLLDHECPLMIQEDLMKKLGYRNEFRRSRMGIDLDLKYLLRFHIGPAEVVNCRGVSKSGQVEILKGLVRPQWKIRSMCVVASKLIIFPANNCVHPESFELSGAEVHDEIYSNGRMVIRVTPRGCEGLAGEKGSPIYNSNQSLASSSGEKERVLFLGFTDEWERDLWSSWLTEASTETSNGKCMDIGNSGLQTIPEIVLQSTSIVEELLAGQNKLQEIGLMALSGFPCLKILRLPGNEFKMFPESLLQITALTVLDLADNEIQSIPDDISNLQNLQELRIDRNALTELPNSVRLLSNLQSLQAAQNRIERLPEFLLGRTSYSSAPNMKTMGLVDAYSQKVNNMIHNQHQNRNKQGEQKPPLNRISLRSNQLKGNIILGNYGNLTQLDVSDNQIESMNLSALDKLESLQCSRNHLVELIVSGKSITSLIAGNNKLLKLVVTPSPTNLRHLDLSYNNLTELPDWLNGCHQLRTLFASNNYISHLPEYLFTNDRSNLHTLQLGYNRIVRLPGMTKKRLPLRELFLQSNLLEDLGENFFSVCENLTLLNVAGNKLRTLPSIVNADDCHCQLERLYATDNALTDRVLDTIVHLSQLRILHAAYNRLTVLPENCAAAWPDMEELVLSGNRLQHLPENLAALKSLRVLRVHSNQLQTVPALAKTNSLRVLDLAHNRLDRINLVALVPRRLQFLDLSGNAQLQVDARQLQVCKSQRLMSLVDVSGQNRDSLPTINQRENGTHGEDDEEEEGAYHRDIEPPWKLGFSETPGQGSKLYIGQLRLAGFCNGEGLFGLFDGEHNRISPSALVKTIPKILVEERTIPETAVDYMKYTLLAAHRELKQQGQKLGISATLCHVSRTIRTTTVKEAEQEDDPENEHFRQSPLGKKFVLRVASVGESSAILIRATGCVQLTPGTPNRQLGCSVNYPMIVPDPEVCEVPLSEQADEYLVVANKKLWDVLSAEQVSHVIRSEAANVLLAAKRIQDIAQAYGVEDNLSVIVVKFQLRAALRADMEHVMRELRHTIKKRPTTATTAALSGFCKCGCCCEANSNCCRHAITSNGQHAVFVRQPSSSRSDRSSPSGQSDPAIGAFDQQQQQQQQVNATSAKGSVASRRSGASYTANERRSLRGTAGTGGVVRAVRARIEEEREKEESDSAMSEEQFKCWEYMLEQNTQLLFDKELNTISKAFANRRPSLVSAVVAAGNGAAGNLSRTQLKALSTSSPQLQALHERFGKSQLAEYNLTTASSPAQANVPFLSKHFGSARSFHPQQQQQQQAALSASTNGLFRTMRFNGNRGSAACSIQGGPNAAYFGSLQRLMPYNLEYDYAVMQEREDVEGLEGGGADDRMGQYWGVATTEL